jgi:hypothetical protein
MMVKASDGSVIWRQELIVPAAVPPQPPAKAAGAGDGNEGPAQQAQAFGPNLLAEDGATVVGRASVAGGRVWVTVRDHLTRGVRVLSLDAAAGKPKAGAEAGCGLTAPKPPETDYRKRNLLWGRPPGDVVGRFVLVETPEGILVFGPGDKAEKSDKSDKPEKADKRPAE